MAMKAAPGAELACRARNHTFEHQGNQVDRGVVSYYAAQTLPYAATAEDWLQAIARMAASEHHNDLLPASHLPSLQVLGDSTTPLPGNPVQPR